MFELKIKTYFAAAHRLTLVGQKCETLHGHNWLIEACVVGEKLNNGGVLIDFGEIKSYIGEIMTHLDHKYLNEIDAFSTQPPSSENIALYVARELQQKIIDPSIRVSRISAWESNSSCATFIVGQNMEIDHLRKNKLLGEVGDDLTLRRI